MEKNNDSKGEVKVTDNLERKQEVSETKNTELDLINKIMTNKYKEDKTKQNNQNNK